MKPNPIHILTTGGNESGFRIRPLGKSDQDFLWDILYEALWDPPAGPRRPRGVLENPVIAAYVADWGSSPHDLGFIIETEQGERVGAVWSRLLVPPLAGGAFLDSDTPQLGIALLPTFQGRGLGETLLRHHLAASAARYDRMTLGVHPANRRAIQLYERCVFERYAFGRGSYWNMVRHLRGQAPVTPLRLRHAIPADQAALLTLTQDCVKAMRSEDIDQWDEVYPSAGNISTDIEARTLDVLCAGGDIVACITLDHQFDPLWDGLDWSAAGEPAVALHRLMVHPSQQGRGLAKRLMQHAEDVARAKGCRSIRLDTFLQNPAAMALYRGLGYRRTGTAMMRKGEFAGFEKLL